MAEGEAGQHELKSPAPLKVFIVGAPRSGTSVLMRAMKEVFLLPGYGESHVMPMIQRVVHESRQYLERFERYEMDLLISHFTKARLENAVFDCVRSYYADVYGGESWADKTPTDEAIYGVPLVNEIFPDARVLITKRTGIEVVDSYCKKFKADFVDSCENWVRVMAGIGKARKHGRNVVCVDQYDFTNDSRTVAELIATHLGQPNKSDELKIFLRNNREDRFSRHDWSRRQTLDTIDWTDRQKEVFRAICEPVMREFNYPVWDSELEAGADATAPRIARRVKAAEMQELH
jgi:hypothetical protein